jgi:fatty-acyl-CoA synthase
VVRSEPGKARPADRAVTVIGHERRSRQRAGVRDVLDRIFPAGSTSPAGDRQCLLHEGRTLTYAQVGKAIRAAGDQLARLGLRPQDGVALLADNSPEYVLGFLTALYYGYRLTPLQVKASRETWISIVTKSRSKAVIHDVAHADDASYLAAQISCVSVVAAVEELVGHEPGPAGAAGFDPPSDDDPALISFTGGTTGQPKGVIQPYRVVLQNLLMEMAEWPWPESPRLVVTTPLSHGAGFMLLPTLYRGGAVITGDMSRPSVLMTTIATCRADSVFLVPSLMYKLLDLPKETRAALTNLRFTVYGASPIIPARLAEVLESFGGKIVQLYGQTEAPMIVTTLSDGDHRRTDHESILLSCGRAVAGASVRIEADGRTAEVGEVGEICVSGPLVTDGYWDDPEETERIYRDGWLRTGDLGYQDAEGYIFLVGRSKEMFISGGFNIYPKEVEDALVGIPGVQLAAVVGVPDPLWGEASIAFVVSDGVTADEIRSQVRERKGPILVPKIVEFIESLPLTDVGKPDKAALKAMFLERVSRTPII